MILQLTPLSFYPYISECVTRVFVTSLLNLIFTIQILYIPTYVSCVYIYSVPFTFIQAFVFGRKIFSTLTFLFLINDMRHMMTSYR